MSQTTMTMSMKDKCLSKWTFLCDVVEDFGLLATTFAILIFFVVFFGIMSPRFFTVTTVTNILTRTSIYVILAVGMTFVLTTGSIDISIGSQIGLITGILGLSMVQFGLSFWLGLIIAVLVGASCGSFNGFLVSKIKVPAIVTTLGTMTFFRGLAYMVSGGTVFLDFPKEFIWLGQGRIFGFIPVPVLIAVFVVAWGHLFLKHTRRGSHITAVGGNPEAAKLAGINNSYNHFIVFLIMGIMVALATVVMVARISAAQSVMGEGMEVHTISAVVLGGTSLFGGKSTILGSVLGALVLGVLETGLLLIRVSYFWQLVVMGLIFISVVTIRTAYEKKAVSST